MSRVPRHAEGGGTGRAVDAAGAATHPPAPLAALLVGGEGGARAILFSFQDVPLLTALRLYRLEPCVGGAPAPSQPGAPWVWRLGV